MVAIAIEQKYKTFTIEEVYNALAANGLDHLRSEWISVENDKVIGGCALGQAAYNLGVPATEEYPEWTSDEKYELNGNVPYGNLYDELTGFTAGPSKWLDDYRERNGYSDEWEPEEDDENYNPSIAQVIIFFNDLLDASSSNGYALETYADVAAMAKEVMSPFFSQEIKLPHYEY